MVDGDRDPWADPRVCGSFGQHARRASFVLGVDCRRTNVAPHNQEPYTLAPNPTYTYRAIDRVAIGAKRIVFRPCRRRRNIRNHHHSSSNHHHNKVVAIILTNKDVVVGVVCHTTPIRIVPRGNPHPPVVVVHNNTVVDEAVRLRPIMDTIPTVPTDNNSNSNNNHHLHGLIISNNSSNA